MLPLGAQLSWFRRGRTFLLMAPTLVCLCSRLRCLTFRHLIGICILKKKKKATSNCLFFLIRCCRIHVSMTRKSTLCVTKMYNSGVLLSWHAWWNVFMYPLDVFHMYIWERAQIKCVERRSTYKNTYKLIGRRFCQSHSSRTNQISTLHQCPLTFWPAQRKSDGRFFKMELQDFRLKKSDPSKCLARLKFS